MGVETQQVSTNLAHCSMQMRQDGHWPRGAYSPDTSDTEMELNPESQRLTATEIERMRVEQRGFDPRSGPRWDSSFIAKTFQANELGADGEKLKKQQEHTWLGHGDPPLKKGERERRSGQTN